MVRSSASSGRDCIFLWGKPESFHELSCCAWITSIKSHARQCVHGLVWLSVLTPSLAALCSTVHTSGRPLKRVLSIQSKRC